MNVRELTLSLLCDFENSGKYVNLSLSSHLADKLTAEDRGFLTALLYTSVERKITYDYYVGAISERSLDKIDPTTLNMLRIGLCQIIDMDNIPDYAAVDETVRLGRNHGERSFVNGVLRKAVRLKNEDKLPLPKREKNLARFLSVAYSYPLWIVKHFIALFGEENAERLLSHYNTVRYTDLTVNLTKISRDDYLGMLTEAGYTATASEYSSMSVRLDSSVNPRRLPGFDEGLFFVQDCASAISAQALGAAGKDRVIDVCSCPGGKSFAAAILAGGECEVLSLDIHESKLSLVIDGAQRLGLSCITVAEQDATHLSEECIEGFDKVICDVPCSGLGVLAKKPDIRYKDNQSLQNLPDIQLDILRTSSRYVKDGGVIIYSTCTLNPKENEDVVREFLIENTSFTLVPFTAGTLASDDGMLTLVPYESNTDGFFIAKLKKEKNND